MVRSLILAVVASIGISVAGATPAAAGHFCPGDPTVQFISLNGRERCIWLFHNSISNVGYRNALTSVLKCGMIKSRSDGLGPDVGGPADCQPGTAWTFVGFAFPGVSGYAVGLNQSDNFHTGFQGDLNFY